VIRQTRRADHGWTHRHADVVGLVAIGMTNEEIGERLHISQNTVRKHLSHMQEEHMARNRAHLVFLAMRQGVIS
jgi:DNA-binding CsgD family transcriptional regulator